MTTPPTPAEVAEARAWFERRRTRYGTGPEYWIADGGDDLGVSVVAGRRARRGEAAMNTVYDWAVWSKFDDDYVMVDSGDPTYCQEGAARRNAAAAQYGVPQMYFAGTVNTDDKILRPWQTRTYVEQYAGRRERRRERDGLDPLPETQARRWAKEQGFKVGTRGRLPGWILSEYQAAHDEEQQR